MLTVSEYCQLTEFHIGEVVKELHEVTERLFLLVDQWKEVREALGVPKDD